eukprot:365067-Chlamydomonas_euryale.AAC.21
MPRPTQQWMLHASLPCPSCLIKITRGVPEANIGVHVSLRMARRARGALAPPAHRSALAAAATSTAPYLFP